MNELTYSKLAEKALDLLKSKGMTLAVAESCTGGLISKLITDIDGASAAYKGGVCTYCNESKVKLLNVRRETLIEHGAVSSQTAREMALGVTELFKSDIGISVTGIAGPRSDNSSKPVGLIYIGVCRHGKISVTKLKNVYTEDIRENNRYSAASAALNMLLDTLQY